MSQAKEDIANVAYITLAGNWEFTVSMSLNSQYRKDAEKSKTVFVREQVIAPALNNEHITICNVKNITAVSVEVWKT